MLTPVIKEGEDTPSAPHLFLSFWQHPSSLPPLISSPTDHLFFSFSFLPTLSSLLLSQSHICLIRQPRSPSPFSPSFPLVDVPTLSAHVWCPPSDQLQLGRAGENNIVTTGLDGDSSPLPVPTCANTFQETGEIRWVANGGHFGEKILKKWTGAILITPQL